MILADKIIEERKRNGWSQEEFAEQGHDESLELEFFGGQTTYVFDNILSLYNLEILNED